MHGLRHLMEREEHKALNESAKTIEVDLGEGVEPRDGWNEHTVHNYCLMVQKRYGLKWDIKAIEGPGGWPTVHFTGDEAKLKKFLRDEMGDDDLETYLAPGAFEGKMEEERLFKGKLAEREFRFTFRTEKMTREAQSSCASPGLPALLAKLAGLPRKSLYFDDVDLVDSKTSKTLVPGALDGKYTLPELVEVLKRATAG